ncbi:MAG: hypothetical protein JWR75_1755 [Devosia sp.]|nr:hypothetical protein [Devosia sp.]
MATPIPRRVVDLLERAGFRAGQQLVAMTGETSASFVAVLPDLERVVEQLKVRCKTICRERFIYEPEMQRECEAIARQAFLDYLGTFIPVTVGVADGPA